MTKGGAVCLLFQDNGPGNQHENKKRETDYFSICKIYAMLKVENERWQMYLGDLMEKAQSEVNLQFSFFLQESQRTVKAL